MAPRVGMRGITKRYGPLVANASVSVEFEPGQIHVLVGENGAGKSTLMNVLAGLERPDEGQVMLGDRDVTELGTRERIELGVGMVHQHFKLVDVFTVAENVALGAEPTKAGPWLDRGAARATARDVSEQFGLALDPDAVVADLPIGMQQRVEIVKVLSRRAEVLVFDEPTAVLTDTEAEALFGVMRALRASGRTIVFITHKLGDALALADRISVLRRGHLVATIDPSATTVEELGTLMVGRELGTVDRGAGPGGLRGVSPVLSIDSIQVPRDGRHSVPLDDISIDVRPGEIVGVLGVEGNGQGELAGVLTGRIAPARGRVVLDGRDLTGRPPAAFLRAGLGVVPADRQRDGLALSMSIARNLVLDRRRERQFTRCRGLLLDNGALSTNATTMIEQYDIRAPGPDAPARTLSGGNQQKVILARELERDVKAVVVSHPTRGLDVGSIEYVHGRLVQVAASGSGVVLITSDIDEALALSDRIVVLYRGSVAGEESRPCSRERIGLLMGGGRNR